MGIKFDMFWFAFWVFSTQQCEAVIFTKFGSACAHARPLNYLDVLVLHRACSPCMCMHVMHARHDVTRFTYNANHVIMILSAFVFHFCDVGMRWHNVIGVHVA